MPPGSGPASKAAPAPVQWVLDVSPSQEINRGALKIALKDANEVFRTDPKVSAVIIILAAVMPSSKTSASAPKDMSVEEAVEMAQEEEDVIENLIKPLQSLAGSRKTRAVMHIEKNDSHGKGLCDTVTRFSASRLYIGTRKKLLWSKNPTETPFFESNLPDSCTFIIVRGTRKVHEVKVVAKSDFKSRTLSREKRVQAGIATSPTGLNKPKPLLVPGLREDGDVSSDGGSARARQLDALSSSQVEQLTEIVKSAPSSPLADKKGNWGRQYSLQNPRSPSHGASSVSPIGGGDVRVEFMDDSGYSPMSSSMQSTPGWRLNPGEMETKSSCATPARNDGGRFCSVSAGYSGELRPGRERAARPAEAPSDAHSELKDVIWRKPANGQQLPPLVGNGVGSSGAKQQHVADGGEHDDEGSVHGRPPRLDIESLLTELSRLQASPNSTASPPSSEPMGSPRPVENMAMLDTHNVGAPAGALARQDDAGGRSGRREEAMLDVTIGSVVDADEESRMAKAKLEKQKRRMIGSMNLKRELAQADEEDPVWMERKVSRSRDEGEVERGGKATAGEQEEWNARGAAEKPVEVTFTFATSLTSSHGTASGASNGSSSSLDAHGESMSMGSEVTAASDSSLSRSGQFSMDEFFDLRHFSVSQLKEATDDFAAQSFIGKGGSGSVFKGSLFGCDVAVKRLDITSKSAPVEFRNEVEILSKVRHPHIVLLMGHCFEEAAVVYEYMHGGSLKDRLRSGGGGDAGGVGGGGGGAAKFAPLSWTERFRIAAEVSGALHFMHQHRPPIMHGDLKPDNILIDAKGTSKIADVGLARLIPEDRLAVTFKAQGTFGFMDPEGLTTGEQTVQSDVYALGLVFLMLITNLPVPKIHDVLGKLSRDGVMWELDQAVAAFLPLLDRKAGKCPTDLVKAFLRVVLRCVERKRESRPDLGTAVQPELLRIANEATGRMSQRAMNVEKSLLCPLSLEPMVDPVVAADGFTYERKNIELWLKQHNVSPTTGEALAHFGLTPNRMVLELINSVVKEEEDF